MELTPTLVHRVVDGIDVLTDQAALDLGVCVAFTGRDGGVSSEPYRSLNLALTSDDDPSKVTENRRRVAEALGFDPRNLALARQIHGTRVVEVESGRSGVVGEADGLVTSHEEVVLAIMTADCTPVALLGDKGVGMLHAGWRGVVGGVVERGLEMVGRARAAWVGPSIHSCCYEVGPEVIAAFKNRGLPVADDSHVDPSAAVVQILTGAGVPFAIAPECTFHDHGYFSYRRDGVTGRQGAFVWLG